MNDDESQQILVGDEFLVLQRIRVAQSTDERNRLIDELVSLPVRFYPFSARWLIINDVEPWGCWTDDGYDSSVSSWPRDIQLLAATRYGHADMLNGGFHQFFSNSTGGFAPEMVEWFERSDLLRAAIALKTAMTVFGERFPRPQGARNVFLSNYPGDSREENDPFYTIEGDFFDSLPHEQRTFECAADRWLRDVCGVATLHQQLASDTKE